MDEALTKYSCTKVRAPLAERVMRLCASVPLRPAAVSAAAWLMMAWADSLTT